AVLALDRHLEGLARALQDRELVDGERELEARLVDGRLVVRLVGGGRRFVRRGVGVRARAGGKGESGEQVGGKSKRVHRLFVPGAVASQGRPTSDTLRQARKPKS